VKFLHRIFGGKADSRTEMPADYLEARIKALEALKRKEPQEAFSSVRLFLEYPGKITSTAHLQDILGIFAGASLQMGEPKIAKLAEKLKSKPDDVQTSYELAYEMYEQQLYGWAATLLWRALASAPERTDIVSELVGCFEYLGRNQAACDVLFKVEQHFDDIPVLRYLLAFNLLMTGDVSGSKRHATRFISDANGNEQMLPLARSLTAQHARCDALLKGGRLGSRDLRGWHMALNASFLLHLSEFGLDENMNGRYAFMSDSYALCREGIERIQLVLSAADRTPTCVLALPDRYSQILAHATASILGVPCSEWTTDGAEPGLVVAYDLSTINDGKLIMALREVKPRQILWEHASCWTKPPYVAADIVTFLYQYRTAPWQGGRMRLNPESREVTHLPEDEGPVAEVAAHIVESESVPLNDANELISLLEAVKRVPDEHAAGLLRASGERALSRVGSPVGSSRFL
jgi:hypothetical protein